MLKRLWLDEGGAVLSTELILLLVITVIGVSVGLVVLRDAVVSELQMVASVINGIDPGVAWAGLLYEGNSSGAEAQGTQATVSTLGWDEGTGFIINSVTADLDVYIGTDSMTPETITESP